MKFSLVIPCYNEAKNIPLLLERCGEFSHREDIEIILVDNGSNDDTAEVLQMLLDKYPQCRSIKVEQNIGYGSGILSGLKAARGEILGWTHADMQTDPNDVLIGLKLFDKYGTELFVKGQRYGRPMIDRMFTLGMSLFETILLKTYLWDINAQPTMFHRNFFETWSEAPHDFSLDLYAFYLARRSNMTVKRFSVKFGERAHGKSHWNVNWSSKYKFIKRTIKFSLNLRDNVLK